MFFSLLVRFCRILIMLHFIGWVSKIIIKQNFKHFNFIKQSSNSSNQPKQLTESKANMSAKKMAPPKRKSHPAYKFMIFEAIASQRTAGKGASRAAIANYIQSTYKVKAGAAFNTALRRALAAGIKSGVIAQGASAQRFKMTESGRTERKNANKPKPKKKTKKKVTKTKKKTTKKKKKTTKKKKVSKKKEQVTEKKKAASKKKKKASKKKKTSKKRVSSRIKKAEAEAKKVKAPSKRTKVQWLWAGHTCYGTLIKSMENEQYCYARTRNGTIKTLSKSKSYWSIIS